LSPKHIAHKTEGHKKGGKHRKHLHARQFLRSDFKKKSQALACAEFQVQVGFVSGFRV
jgi:hypothetical protein